MKKREQIYTFLIDFIKEKGYQPTVREIAHAVNLKSSSSVYRHLEMLEKDGLIILGKSEQRGRKRSIHIIDYIVTVDNILPDDIIIIEKVNSLEKDSIGLLLFENHTFIKKIFSDYEKVYDTDPVVLGKIIGVYRDFFWYYLKKHKRNVKIG